MIKEKNISDRKKEIILYKFMSLINKGYSVDYCQTKFSKYRNITDEYLPLIEQLRKLKRIMKINLKILQTITPRIMQLEIISVIGKMVSLSCYQ